MTPGNAPNKEPDAMSQLPRGIRNNNPGNLDYVGQPGAHLETGVPCPALPPSPPWRMASARCATSCCAMGSGG